MRIAVLIGFNENGDSEPLASGTFTEMNKMAKEMTIENKTKWPKVRIFDNYNKQYTCAAPKPRGRKPKQVEE
jgi:hypothetical protein